VRRGAHTVHRVYWQASLIEWFVFRPEDGRSRGDAPIEEAGRTRSGENPADELRLGLGVGLAIVGVLSGGSAGRSCRRLVQALAIRSMGWAQLDAEPSVLVDAGSGC
jgi:hypothetical protein